MFQLDISFNNLPKLWSGSIEIYKVSTKNYSSVAIAQLQSSQSILSGFLPGSPVSFYLQKNPGR